MLKTVGITDLGHGFRSVLDDMVHSRVPCILTRGSRPEAVLLPYDEFAQYQRLRENAVLARFDQLRERMAERHASTPDDEVAADVAAAREELAG